MAIYAIGDVQGCFTELELLLQQLSFDFQRDTLWFTGDLVNRGPDSLQVLRFVRDLGDRAVCVLGNHDLHLLAVACGQSRLRKGDTLEPILQSPDSKELLAWLRRLPLAHHDPELSITMVHAGMPPQWTLAQALQLAEEVEQVLRSPEHKDFFAHMYGDMPLQWNGELQGWDRLRFITNCFTRLRYLDIDGRLCLGSKGPVGSQPERCMPWFSHPHRHSATHKLLFGHWSTLGFYNESNVLGLDSGCLWGGALSAVRLDHGEPGSTLVQLDCQGERQPALG